MFDVVAVKGGKFTASSFIFNTLNYGEDGKFYHVDIVKDVESVTLLDKEETTSLLKVGVGALVGGVLLGGIGTLAGCFLSGKNKTLVVKVKFKGRKELIAKVDPKVYARLESAVFRRS